MKRSKKDHSKIYAEEGNNQTRTAERLGINRTTLWRKLKSSD
ncbi:helix-turn-helix domain-containing protein [Bacillus licheniformis]|nr:helix-turn-helix domain-containing protein [Bacillus licheniformis]